MWFRACMARLIKAPGTGECTETFLPRWRTTGACAMQDAARFRKYADECRRLAQTLPAAHKQTLLEIADAWTACAEEAERQAQNPKT
jgi:hypothetical protein